jgi:phospholipase/lecithinase/hemolysin
MATTSPLFDELYAVGDSLSDSGGIYRLSSLALSLVPKNLIDGLQPIPISPPYAMRFSDGPVLPEITAQLLGATLINFSFGGAEALSANTLLNLVPPDLLTAINALPEPLQSQVEAVLSHVIDLPGQLSDLTAALTANPPSEDSALVSLIGLNDLQSLDPTDPNLLNTALTTATGIVAANHQVATTAFSLGIDTVIYETLPAISFFPAAHAFSSQIQMIGDIAVDFVNHGLQLDALAFQQEGFYVRIVDIARMASEVSSDPGTFGFLNFDQPTLLGNGIEFELNHFAPPPEQTAFFDPLHPTTNLHGVLGVFAAESLTSNTIFGDAGDNTITGTSGDDLVLAGKGNDQVQLGAGDDILLAGLGNDTAHGGQDSDLMSGGLGDDILSGDNGSDVVVGNGGNDTMNGGNGDDALIDGLGSDTANGGNGNDVFLYTQAQILGGTGIDDNDHFDGGNGFDTLVLLVTPETLAVEQPIVAANFVPGNHFTFSTVNLTITGIEQVVFTTDFGVNDVELPGGELGARLREADLFGFV